MLDAKMQEALNRQLNEEQTASQEYLAMAAWFEEQNLRGFAAFMRRQSNEERAHALKFFDHIVDRGGRVRLGQIKAPRETFESALDVFRAALERERANTRSINEVYKLSSQLNDYPSHSLLQWFIDEQVEEEQWAEEAVALLERAADNPSALLMLDNRYATFETEG